MCSGRMRETTHGVEEKLQNFSLNSEFSASIQAKCSKASPAQAVLPSLSGVDRSAPNARGSALESSCAGGSPPRSHRIALSLRRELESPFLGNSPCGLYAEAIPETSPARCQDSFSIQMYFLIRPFCESTFSTPNSATTAAVSAGSGSSSR